MMHFQFARVINLWIADTVTHLGDVLWRAIKTLGNFLFPHAFDHPVIDDARLRAQFWNAPATMIARSDFVAGIKAAIAEQSHLSAVMNCCTILRQSAVSEICVWR